MMAVGFPERFRAHPEIASGFVQIGSGLHLPRRGRVTPNVRAVFAVASFLGNRFPSRVYALHFATEVVADRCDAFGRITGVPPSKVGQ